MDINANAQKYAYVTGITKPFTMPTGSGGILAVAFTKKTADYVSSAYTLLVVLIFMIGWKLALAILMRFREPGKEHGRTPLASLWNSGQSMNVEMVMASYCKGAMPGLFGDSPEGASMKWEPKDLLWGLPFAFIALGMTVGNVLAGVLVPGQLSIGNVAPPDKNLIFYPDVTSYARDDDNGAANSKLNSLKAPSALRALGAVEDSPVELRKLVYIGREPDGNSTHLKYGYNVTGVDLGLQSDPKLKLMVKGSCRTDDTWFLNSSDQVDSYRLFDGNEIFEAKYQPTVDLPPMVNFMIHGDTVGSSNVSYAMIVTTAGLYSYTSSKDPWYATEKTVNGSIAYKVRRGRPALSCWEATTWHLNGKDVEGSKLNTLPGLRLHDFWVERVFPYEFGIPRIVNIGRLAGTSALKSVFYTTAPYFILDAGKSTLLDDFERLVLASWVSSRNVLRDTTTTNPGDMVNLAKGPGGSVDAGYAKFVLQSVEVVTFSVYGLISLPAFLLFMFIIQKSFSSVLQPSNSGYEPTPPSENEEDRMGLVTVKPKDQNVYFSRINLLKIFKR